MNRQLVPWLGKAAPSLVLLAMRDGRFGEEIGEARGTLGEFALVNLSN